MSWKSVASLKLDKHKRDKQHVRKKSHKFIILKIYIESDVLFFYYSNLLVLYSLVDLFWLLTYMSIISNDDEL